MPDMRVQGADELAALAKRLKEVGDKDLRKELYRGLARAAKPMKAAGQKAALESLPKKGGLAGKVAKARYSTRTRSTGQMVGVRVTAKGPKNEAGQEIDIRSLNRGRLRHPVFPKKHQERKDWTWADQRVPDYWWTDAMQIAADEEVRDALLQVIADVRGRLEAR